MENSDCLEGDVVNNVTEFIRTRDVHYMYQCRKEELLVIASHFGIILDSNGKENMQKEISSWLKENESSDEMKKEDRMRLDLEMIQLKLADKDREIRLKELEVRKLEIENQSPRHGISEYDLRMTQLPEYVESEAENFFIQFEKIASMRAWPKGDWAFLIQSRLKGKAREAYVCLSQEECAKYDCVKEAVLKTFELVPERYRERFRATKKSHDQTFLEFARICEMRFDQWCKSVKVTSVEEMKELVLLEHFYDSMNEGLRKKYMNEV